MTGRLRLRTKFLIATLLTSAGLTAVSLLIVQRTVEHQVRQGLTTDLANSVETFRNVQKEREASLLRSAGLLADIPSVKALMTSHDPPTIQDGSRNIFRLSGGDLLVLLNRGGEMVAFHSRRPQPNPEEDANAIRRHELAAGSLQWWLVAGHLYEVALSPIYFGPQSDNSVLGTVGVGYEVNDGTAAQVGQVAASEVAILYGDTVVASTLDADQGRELTAVLQQPRSTKRTADWRLGRESFVVSSLPLNPGQSPPVTMLVLKSYDQATAFLDRLRQLLLAVGLGAVLLGSLLVYLIARNFTRPLEKLVEGVRALGHGDFRYPLASADSGEVAEVTNAFRLMRERLLETQQKLLHAERLATIGRMASSISHDLRHPLTAVLANAEFLADAELNPEQREELYLEIRFAVHRLTDLIDSLLELSRPADSLNLTEAPVERTISRAIELVRAHPELQRIVVAIESSGSHSAHFDGRKLERVFYNLLLNACQATQAAGGHVGVAVAENDGNLDIRVTDDGPGIDDSIRDKLFQPFVSHGKENGTGLGLTIAQKIVQDHAGSLQLESSVRGRTVMRISLPKAPKPADPEPATAMGKSQHLSA